MGICPVSRKKASIGGYECAEKRPQSRDSSTLDSIRMSSFTMPSHAPELNNIEFTSIAFLKSNPLFVLHLPRGASLTMATI